MVENSIVQFTGGVGREERTLNFDHYLLSKEHLICFFSFELLLNDTVAQIQRKEKL